MKYSSLDLNNNSFVGANREIPIHTKPQYIIFTFK